MQKININQNNLNQNVPLTNNNYNNIAGNTVLNALQSNSSYLNNCVVKNQNPRETEKSNKDTNLSRHHPSFSSN